MTRRERQWPIVIIGALIIVMDTVNAAPSSERMPGDEYQLGSDDQNYYKRASFMPARGKKPQNGDGEFNGHQLDEYKKELDSIKRASAFLPMRGRKDDDGIDKKSAFMPMRGRKNDQSDNDQLMEKKGAFMPMRGRKSGQFDNDQLMDKRSSFMPMRGRKSIPEVNDDRANIGQYNANIESYMPDSHKMDSEWHWIEGENRNDKRGSSFYGTRGKRHIGQRTHDETFMAARG